MNLINNFKKNTQIVSFDLIKKFVTYSSGTLILKAVSATIGLVTIKFLSPQEYGLLSLLNNFILIAPIIFNLGLRQAYGIEFFHLDHQKRKFELNNVIGIYLFTALPIFLISLMFLKQINSQIFFNLANNKLILITLVASFIHFFSELYLQILRYQCKTYELISTQIGASIVTVFSTIIFVYFYNLKVTGVLVANFLSIIFLTILGFKSYLQKLNQDKFKILNFKPKIFYYLKLGLPFVPNIFFMWILGSSSRWFLAKYSTLENVGIYSFADYFCQLFNFVVLYSLSSTYVPYIFNKFSENKNRVWEIYNWNLKLMWLTMFGMLFCISFGYMIAKIFLIKFLPIAYHSALKYIWSLLIGQIFFMGSYFATTFLQFYKRITIILIATIIGSTITVLLNFILTPKIGIWGATFACISGYASYFMLILILTIHKHKKIGLKI